MLFPVAYLLDQVYSGLNVQRDEDIGLQRCTAQATELRRTQHGLDGQVRTWVLGIVVWAHVGSCRRDADHVLGAGPEGGKVECGFLGEVVGQIV
jgi:hypothetical protein